MCLISKLVLRHLVRVLAATVRREECTRCLLVAPTVAELRIQRLPTLLPMNGGELITND